MMHLFIHHTLPHVERAKLYERLIKYSINQNLSIPLTDSTEENWEDAFGAIEVLFYKSPFSDRKSLRHLKELNREVLIFKKHYWNLLIQITRIYFFSR